MTGQRCTVSGNNDVGIEKHIRVRDGQRGCTVYGNVWHRDANEFGTLEQD